MSLKTILTCDQCEAPIAMLEDAPKDLELLATCWACATKKARPLESRVEKLDAELWKQATANGKAKPDAVSASTIRLDELRDLHGPVFRVIPKAPVEAGQVIQNGDGSKVEMLEPDALNEKPGHWFAKQVD